MRFLLSILLLFFINLATGQVKIDKEFNRRIGLPSYQCVNLADYNFDSLNLPDILNHEIIVTKKSSFINEGYKTSKIGVLFDITNNGYRDHYAIDIGTAFLKKGKLIELDSNNKFIQEYKIGFDYNHENEIASSDVSLIVPVNKNKTSKFLLAIDTGGYPINFKISIWDPQVFLAKEQNIMFYISIFFGIIFIVLAYNGCLYYWSRSKTSLYYFIYVLSVGLIYMIIENVSEIIFGQVFGWMTIHMLSPISFLVHAFTFIFLREYFEIGSEYKKLNKIISASVSINVIMAGVSLFVPLSALKSQFTIITIQLFLIVTLGIVVYLITQKNRKALLYLFAYSFVAFGATVKLMTVYGILETESFHKIAFFSGAAIEVTLLTISIAYSQFQEKIKLKDLAFSKQLELNELSKKNQEELEKEVAQRTTELEEQKNLMSVKNEEITRTNKKLELAIKVADQNSKIKEDFLASMSHEIRTPLNGIIGTLELLNDNSLSEKQKDALDLVRYSSNNLNQIINDILDLAKIEAKQMELTPKNFNLFNEVKNGINLFEAKAIEKKLKIKYIHDSKIPEQINADGIKVMQVVLNYLSNAIKFSEKNDIIIKSELVNSVTVHISVKDFGIGIDSEKIDSLFKKFQQVSNDDKFKNKGTGLGLAISKELAILLGGNVGVSSKLNEGSTFWLTFKFDHAEKIKEHKSFDSKSFDFSDKKILIAEDVLTNQKLISMQMNRLKIENKIVNNGKELIEEIVSNKEKWDLIITDIQMPEMDGVEAAHLLRVAHKNTTPIVALSANSEDQLAPSQLNLFDYYIEKPFRLNDLTNILAKAFKKTVTIENKTTNEEPEKKCKITFDELFDTSFYNDLLEHSRAEHIKEMYKTFLDDSKNIINSINKHLMLGNYKELKNKNHSLKGISAFIKANEMYTKCLEIDKKLKKEELKGVENDIFNLNQAYRKTKNAIIEEVFEGKYS